VGLSHPRLVACGLKPVMERRFLMAERDFDCIVVGAGHAGCEAALACARMGCRTLLVTLNADRISYMSCNPSIGGPAKGHVVRELAALGGEMPYNVDRTFLQIRLLNTSKGPAVQALRAQADKARYSQAMKHVLEHTDHLAIRQGMVVAVETEEGAVAGVQLADGGRYSARAVIVTSGTFLAAQIMGGRWHMPAGRAGDPPAIGLSESLHELGLELVRMQTNTPPRIDGRTVDFSLTEPQYGSEKPRYFGLYYDREVPRAPFESEDISSVYPVDWQSRWRPQLPCYLVRTNAQTHKIVRENLHRSPIVAGISQGAGPRYCPSFEEKIIRFPDRESHLIFLEPEGYGTSEVYVQGFFTALAVDVQEAMLRTIPALRDVFIVRPGYCVEYDVVRAGQIEPSLQAKAVRGLFLAGQVNGTSGYEEAAGQGWLAGANAALYIRGEEPVVLRRDQAYIGVMVDDLVTKEHVEPYRLFTSRAEFRLLLRQDNADLRLARVAKRLGLVSDSFYNRVEQKRRLVQAELRRLDETVLQPDEATREFFAGRGLNAPDQPLTALQLLRWPEIDYAAVEHLCPPAQPLPPEARETVEIEAKYAGYIDRQRRQVEKFSRLESRRIPAGFEYDKIVGLRAEARAKLIDARPLTVGQASRLSGVNPADIAVLLAHLERSERRR